MRTPRSLWILLPFAVIVVASLAVLWITVGDRDASDPVAGASGQEAAQQRIVDRLGLEVPLEGGELEFQRGDLTCSVHRVLASAPEVERAVRATPRRVARNGAGSEGVLLASDEEDPGPCAEALEARLRSRGG